MKKKSDKKLYTEASCIDDDTRERYEKLIKSLTLLFQTKSKDEALEVTIKEINNFINAEGTSVWLANSKDKNKLVLVKTYTNDERVEIGKSFYSKGKLETGSQKGKYEGLTGYIFSTGKPLKINNITDKNEIGQISDSLSWSDKYKGWEEKKEKCRPFLGVPILSIEEKNKVIGVLRIATTKSRKPFTELDLKLSEIFSKILTLKLNSFERKDMELDLFTSLCDYDLTQKHFPSIEDLMNKAIKKFTSLFAGSHGSILLDDGKGRFFLKVSSRDVLMERIINKELDKVFYRAGDGKTGDIIKQKKALLFVSIKENLLKSEKPKNACEIDKPATSFIGAPIVEVSSNKLIGVIRSAKHSENPENDFDESDRILLDLFAKQLSFFISFYNNIKRKNILGIMHGFIDSKDIDSVIENFSIPKKSPEEISIMFVDITSFTDFCNSKLQSDPQKIIAFLNIFFEDMGRFVLEYGGVINAIKGDEFLSIFNGFKECENHRYQAIACACKIVDEFFISFQEKFIKVFDDQFGVRYKEKIFDKIGVKVGIHTTKNVVMGAMGPKDSQTITITGQDVNLASRLITEVADNFQNEKKIILCFASTFNHTNVKNSFESEPMYFEIRGTGELEEHKIFKITGLKE